jgi:lysophospholipase L1-like esterase
MRSLIVFRDVTVDGFMAGPDNDIGFLVDDPRLEEELTGELMSVADIQEVFGLPADPELQGRDGVHPSPAGQQTITRAFVEGLTT